MSFLRIEEIPFLHIPKVRSTETFRLWKSCFQVEAQLLYNSSSPTLLRLAYNEISPQLPVKQQLFCVHLDCCFDLRSLIAAFYFFNPKHVAFIHMHSFATDEMRLLYIFLFHYLIIYSYTLRLPVTTSLIKARFSSLYFSICFSRLAMLASISLHFSSR